MGNIFSGLTISDIPSQATIFIAGLSPYVTFIVGILLALFIIDSIVTMIRGGKKQIDTNKEFDDEY